MRYPASEKLEIIRTVEASHLPVKRTLAMLGIPAAPITIGLPAGPKVGSMPCLIGLPGPDQSGTASPVMFVMPLLSLRSTMRT